MQGNGNFTAQHKSGYNDESNSKTASMRNSAASELERFHFLVEHSSEQIALLSKDCCYEYVNDAFCQRHGYSRDELASLRGWEININGSREDFERLWADAQQHELIQLEVQHRTKSGEIFDLEVRLKYFRFNDEEFLCGFGREISVAKRLEADRKQSEAQIQQLNQALEQRVAELQALLDVLPVGITIAEDPDCRVIRSNPFFQNMLGFDANANVSRTAPSSETLPFKIVQNGQEVPPDQLPMQLAIAQGRAIHNWEGQLIRTDGVSRDMLGDVVPLFDQAGKIRGGIAAFLDITERKQAEELLKQQQEQLRLFVERVPAGVAMFDREMRYLLVSDRWRTSYGLSEQDLVGRSHYEVFPEIAQRWKDIHQRCLAGAIEACEEDPFPREDGSIDWVRWEIHPWRTNNGNIGGIIVFSEVITERKQAQLRSEFLANVSQALVGTTSIEEMVQTIGEHLNRYLNISCFVISEFNEGANEVIVRHTWHLPEVPSLTGVYKLRDYATDELLRAVKVGEPIVYRDVTAEPRRIVDPQRYLALGIGAELNIPFVQNGEWKFSIALYHSTPYHWRDDQIELMRELKEAIWSQIERIRAEDELRRSEAAFRTISNAAPALVWVCSPTGENVYFNDRWYEFTGQTTTEASGHGWVNVMHPEDIVRILPYWERCQQTGEIYEGEVRYRRHDGEYRWHVFRALPRSDANGTIEAWYGCSIDIDDAKRAEAALRDSEQRLQAIIDNSNAAIFMKDVQGRYLLMNRECERLFNITNDWIRGKTDYDLFPLEIADALRENDRHVLDSRNALTLEEDVPLDDGIHTYVAVKFPLIDNAGVPYAICGISTDISDRARLQAERERQAERSLRILEREQAARAEAERANRMKDEFLAVLSHELRTPLNPILGWTKLLQTGRLATEKQTEALNTIERNARLQSQLIEDLLDMSRILRGKLTLTVAPIALSTTIQAAIETVRLAADAKRIEIESIFDSNIRLVSGDASRLQQVVWNLLTNAVKFTPDGGRIEIRLKQVADQARIEVSDTGIGIAPDFLPHVFEHFRQEDSSTTRKFGGLGLGLAIARQIVEQHGGLIWVDSAGENQGTTFTVALRSLEAGSIGVEAVEDAELNVLPLANLRVLVVDDEPDSRDLVAFVAEQAGAEVVAVESAIAALQTLSSRSFDILLSDIGMPDMNGYELLLEVRQRSNDPNQSIRAIALTAYAAEVDQQAARSAGFNQHLAKPVEPDQLVQAILKVVEEDIDG